MRPTAPGRPVLLAAAVILPALAGCASPVERAQADCEAYGFKAGTEAHAACTQQEVAANRAAAMRYAPPPPNPGTMQPPPMQRPTNCTPNGMGGFTCL